jgi:3-dehydroquinate dehydratase/shikimate dehydrogenase
MSSKVVETIVADTMADLRARRDAASPADMVELRLDGVRDLDVAGALEGRTRPAIATCRAAWEGGRFDGSEEERLAVLTRAAELGAEFVDIEWKADAGVRDRCRERTKIVLSHHDFDGVPDDLASRVRDMQRANADVVKVAVTARSLGDCVTLKRATERTPSRVAIAMGAPGQVTRLWPAWMGSAWTYGGTAAPGQASTRELVDRYRVGETTASTKVYAVCGSPLGHSASPAMHNAAFRALGLDAVYLPLDTRSAKDLFEMAGALGLAGASVTIPLKRDLLVAGLAGDPAIDIDELPRQIGALNTLRRDGLGWQGRNFDVAGFLAPLQERGVEMWGRRAVVLGAGGAARAGVAGLRSAGAEVSIAARRLDAARDLAAEFGVGAIEWPPPAGWDLLVNTTPVGMWPRVDESPLDDAALRSASGRVVYDMVYNPMDTRLLQQARAAGATTIGGLEMLVGQACLQLEWWTGRPAPRDVMMQAAEECVRQQS